VQISIMVLLSNSSADEKSIRVY